MKARSERGAFAFFAKTAFQLFFLISLPLFSQNVFCASQTELGSEGDLAVLGKGGTATDPNVKIKGFTVFGSTQASYAGAAAADGNVVINGVLAVSSGAYFVGNSTFPGAGGIFINDGSPGQLLSKAGAGYLQWSDASSLGDNLGNHTAAKALDMAGYPVNRVSSLTVITPEALPSSLWVSTSVFSPHLYVSTSGNVGIGTAAPSYKLQVLGRLGVFQAGDDDQSGIVSTSQNGSSRAVRIWAGNDGTSRVESGLGGAGVLVLNTGSGPVGLGAVAPLAKLDVVSTGTASNVYAQVWRNSSGVTVASMTSQGVLFAVMPPGTGDNLGNHTATQDLAMGGYNITGLGAITQSGSGSSSFNGNINIGSGGSLGTVLVSAHNIGSGSDLALRPGAAGGKVKVQGWGTAWTDRVVVTNQGDVGISTGAPQARLDMVPSGSTPDVMTQVWRTGGGVIAASMSATGVMMASRFIGDGSGLTGAGDNLGNHTAAKALDMAGYPVNRVSSMTIAAPDTVPGALWVSTAGAAAPGLYVSTGGSVGIGTENPSDRLQIRKTLSSVVFGEGTYGTGPGAATAPNMTFSGTPGAGPASWDGSTRFYYTGLGFSISHTGTLTSGPSSGPAGLGLATGGRDNDLFIDAAGNVGVSSTTPGYRLVVSSGAGEAGNLLVISTGASNVIRMTGAGEIYANKIYGDLSGATGLPTGDNLGTHVATQNLDMAGFNIVRVSTLNAYGAGVYVATHAFVMGNFGVGTSSPTYKLHLAGGDLRNENGMRTGNIAEPGRWRFYDISGYLMSRWVPGTDYDTWGLYWDQGNRRMVWRGNGADEAWIDLDDGTGYNAGNFGIGGQPGPASRLEVIGGSVTIQGLASQASVLQAGLNGIVVSTGGAITTAGVGHGAVAGSARGAGAVDLQTARAYNYQVAGGNFSSIAGGYWNQAGGAYSAVGGGAQNIVSNSYAVVPGGISNNAGGQYSVVGGGSGNTVAQDYTVISGGGGNTTGGTYSSIAGGAGNTTGANYAAVGGGQSNSAGGLWSSVGGGQNNVSGGYVGAISGGKNNTTGGQYTSVLGGYYNVANLDYASVGGGSYNTAGGQYASVPGGSYNSAKGQYSFAAGYYSSSTANGAFTWSDSQGTLNQNAVQDMTLFKTRGGFLVTGSTNTNMTGAQDRGFFVSGGGLVGISTGAPRAALDVVAAGAAPNIFAQIWRNSSGVEVASMTSQGMLYATLAPGAGDNLGSHVATQNLNLAQNSAVNVASVTMVGKGLQIGTDLTSSANGVLISNTGAIVTLGAGTGPVAPNARAVGAVDLQTGRSAAAMVSSGTYAAIGGGFGNAAGGYYSVVPGGLTNSAPGAYGAVSGGNTNTASGTQSSVGGGYNNTAAGDNAAVSGGSGNLASGPGAYVGGGQGNAASGQNSAVPGGSGNGASGQNSAVPGGSGNSASGAYASAAGGQANSAAGSWAFAAGGQNNTAKGNASFAAGYYSSSTANGAFTWSDSAGTENVNAVTDRTVFKSRGGFLVTGSTSAYMTGTQDRGVFITGNGLVGVSTGVPYAALDVVSTGTLASQYAQIWRDSGGVIRASMTADGRLYANIAGSIGGGDNLGSHIATQNIQLAGYYLNNDGTASEGIGVDNSGNAVIRAGQLDATAVPPALDVQGAWLRIGDGLSAQAFPNGVGIKFHDQGAAHASQRWDSATQTMRFGRSNTTSAVTFDGEPTLTLDLNNYRIGISTGAPQAKLDMVGNGASDTDYLNIWRNSSGVVVASMTSTGKLFANITGAAGNGDNLGNHTATQDLKMQNMSVVNAAYGTFNQALTVYSSITAAGAAGVGAPRHYFAPNVEISSYSAAYGTGIAVSTLVYTPGLVITGAGELQSAGVGRGTVAGNARGPGAVDLQVNRGAATQVASGGYSAVGGGQNNSAVGQNATVPGGSQNTAGAQYSTVGGGLGNSASGDTSVIPGGASNITSGLYSFAAGYKANSAANGAFTWADSGGVQVSNGVADRTLFKNAGGFLVTGSTSSVLGGTANRGVLVTGNGLVGVSTGSPQAALDVVAAGATPADMAAIWRDSGGNIVSSMSATGVLQAVRFIGDGSQLSGLSGVLSGGQTPRLPYWIGVNALGNSSLSQDGGGITVMNSTFTVQGGAFSVGGATLAVQAGSVGVGTLSPGFISGAGRYLSVLGPADKAAALELAMPTGLGVAVGRVSFANTSGAPAEIARIEAVVKGVSDQGYLRFYTKTTSQAAAERLRVTETGSVGIANTAPDQALTVTGNISQTGVLIASGTGANYFGGVVGIATAAPQAALDIVSTATAANVYSQIWRNGSGVIVASMTSNGVLYGTVANGDNLGNHTATQNLNLASNAIFNVSSLTVVSPDTMAASLWVSTTASAAPNLYLSTSGLLGLGTASPLGKLHIYNNYTSIVASTALVGAGQGSALVPMLQFNTAAAGQAAWDGYTRFTYNADGFLLQHYGGSQVGQPLGPRGLGFSAGGRAAADLFIETNGFVGISSTTPKYMLVVSSGAGEAGNMIVVSTGGSNVIRMTGAGEIYANKFFGDVSGATGLPIGDNLGTHVATQDLNLSGFNILNASSITVAASKPGLTVTTNVYIVNGKLGIGTANPSARMHVTSAGALPGDAIFMVSSGTAVGQQLLTVYGNGLVYARGGVTYAGDLAELYSIEGEGEAGDVVMLGSGDGSVPAVTRASRGGALLGIVATEPGITIGHGDLGQKGRRVPVALSGRVPVKISLENGPVKAGTMLSASAEPGKAAAAVRSGMVIGMALEDFDPAKGGKVLCFVSRQYWVAPGEFESLRSEIEELRRELRRDR